MEVGMFLASVSEQGFQYVVGNQILYQVVGGQSTRPFLNLDSGNCLELLENGVCEGGLEVWNIEGMKVNCVNRDGFDPSLAMSSCSDEESKGSEMLGIQPLAAFREQGGSYSMSLDWVVERVILFFSLM
jgi:hypothetical protein